MSSSSSNAPVPTQQVEQGAEELPVTVPLLTSMGTPGGDPSEVPIHTGDINETPAWFSRHSVFVRNVTIDTGMESGTILDKIPCHPAAVGGNHGYYARMFRAWGGSIDISLKIFATAFHGGAIAVARIPPGMTELDFGTLQKYTIMDWHMSDMRNTQPMTFNLLDQRNILYHYNKQYDVNDLTTYGGSLYVFVLSPLIVGSASGIQQVNMAIFAKFGQNFTLSQMIPVSDPSPVANSFPLYENALNFAYPRHPTNAINMVEAFYVFPSNVVQITNGFFGSAPVYGDFKTRSVQGNVFDYQKQICAIGDRITNFTPATSGPSPNPVNAMPHANKATPSGEGVTDGWFALGRFGTEGENTPFACNIINRNIGVPVAESVTPMWAVNSAGNGFNSTETCQIACNIITNASKLHAQEYSTEESKAIKFGPGVNESFFVFCPVKVSAADYYSIQTLQLMEAIRSTAYVIPEGYAMLFELIDTTTALPIREVKLYREGFMTTNATATPLIITALDHKLVYKNLMLASNPLAPKAALSLAQATSIVIKRSEYVNTN